MSRQHDKAALALGALDGRLAGHPLAAAWACRRRLGAAIAGAGADGIKADADRLVRLLVGLPLTRMIDGGAESAALRIYDVVAAPAHPAEIVMSVLKEATIPGVCAAVAEASGNGLPRSSVHAAFGTVLRTMDLTDCVLVGVSPIGAGEALVNLESSAVQGRRDLDTLSLNWSMWTRLLGKRRSTSRHMRVLAVVAAMTAAAPAQVSRLTGMTTRGAAMLMEEMAALGILRELSDRESWKVFVCRDMPGGAGEGASPSARPEIAVPDLGGLFGDIDRAMAAVSRRLSAIPAPSE